MSIKRASKAILPKPYDYKVSQGKLTKKLIEIYEFFDELGFNKRERLTQNEDGTYQTSSINNSNYDLYTAFYKKTYQTEFIHSIQINTVEIFSYLKEHYFFIHYMLFSRPSFEDFVEHFLDTRYELILILEQIMENTKNKEN